LVKRRRRVHVSKGHVTTGPALTVGVEVQVRKDTGRVECMVVGPNPVANSLSCSNESLQGEGLGGRELSGG
jgi:hypothetical protein